MEDSEKLAEYARLTLYLNNGGKRPLLIYGNPAQREFINTLHREALRAGLTEVKVLTLDDQLVHNVLMYGDDLQARTIFTELGNILTQLVTARGAVIRMAGDEFPDLLSSVSRERPEAYALYMESFAAARNIWINFGINRQLCPWTIVPVATPGWAKQVYPKLTPDKAFTKLTDSLATFTGMSEANPRGYADSWIEKLSRRSAALSALQLKEISIQGGGSNFKIGFTPGVKWISAHGHLADGSKSVLNWPSFETFSTPDWRTAEGTLIATRPVVYQGIVVEGLKMEFSGGRLVSFTAEKESQAFAKFVDQDSGARQLGEFALVGDDSPIAHSGDIFYNILIDENCYSHVALGSAYTDPFSHLGKIDEKRRQELGINNSKLHLDIMVGGSETTFVGTKSNGEQVTILDKGKWTETLR